MTNLELFTALGGISAENLFGAEELQSRPGVRTNGKMKMKRAVLIAAVIALTLLLVGCAVVYVLSLNGIKLGDQLVTYDVYDENPNSKDPFTVVGQETYTQQVLTLAGLDGTPASQAAREWYAFCESYDPDGTIQKAAWGKELELPEEYYGYGLYSQEMKEKLDAILTKYNLKLRGKQVEFKTSKLLFRALGMENVLNPGSETKMNVGRASYYENGNLDLSFDITLSSKDSAAPEKVSGYLHYRSKDCFIPDTAVLTEAQWEEWNYTTASGDDVLIIRSEEASSAWIFCDMPNHTASLRLDTIQKMYEEMENGVPVAKFDIMTKEQLERVADAIDFSLEPKLVEGWETMSDAAVPAGQEINGYRIDPVSAFTDGYGYQIVLRITAPEGVALTNPKDDTARIKSGNGVRGNCKEDGDGKLNTCHYILSNYTRRDDYPEDGSLPYPEGYIIPVYWEDLYFSYYDLDKKDSVVTLLTEGTWKFDIALNDADTREIELLTQPITAKACTGWKIDGTNVLEDVKVTSVKLRSLRVDLTSENENADFFFTDQFVVMKDGSRVAFTWFGLDQPIDLDQVAYVQLADKTIIPMPGVDEKTIAVISETLDTEPEGDQIPVFEDGVELVSEPVTLKNLAGYTTDATGDMKPLYEYFSLSSFVLHPKGAVAQDKRALEALDTVIQVILKDGSQILLTNSGCGRTADGVAFSTFKAESTIDLSKVDHVILPDGTKLPTTNTQ